LDPTLGEGGFQKDKSKLISCSINLLVDEAECNEDRPTAPTTDLKHTGWIKKISKICYHSDKGAGLRMIIIILVI
jgi:hypothetical protein